MARGRSVRPSLGPAAAPAAAPLLVLLLLGASALPALGAATRGAQARRARGAYLGCFDNRALRLSFSAGGGAATANTCKARCAQLGAPMYALSRSLQCACSAVVPNPSLKLPDADCEASSKRAGAVPLFYINADPERSCAVERMPLTADTFEAAYNPKNAQYDSSGGALTLRMQGPEGTRVASAETQLYGMVSFKARASDESGVITAVYLRSDKHEGSKPFDEIVFQWLNGHPATQPGTLWLDTYHAATSQGETRLPPALYMDKTGRTTALAEEYHTYTLDWQPGHVAWYLDGVLLQKQTNEDGAFTSPNRPMHLLASIWSDAARNFQFGGRLDYSRSPFYSSVSTVLRVQCTGDRPYNGPDWANNNADAAAPEAGRAARKAPTDGGLTEEPEAPADAAPVVTESDPEGQDESGSRGRGASGADATLGADDSSASALDEQGGDASLNADAAAADSSSAGSDNSDTALPPPPATPASAAGHSSYLGCFDASKLPGLSFARGIQLNSEDAARCKDHCRTLRMPVYALTRSLRCACTAALPDPDLLKREDSDCEAVRPTAPADEQLQAVAVYYIHSQEWQACALKRTRLSYSTFKPAYNLQNVRYDTALDTLTLRMDGADGVRVGARDSQMWGMFSFRARASDKSGVITAAYLRSDRHEWRDKAFQEIDVLWLNGPPADEPGTLWLNTYYGGAGQGEFRITPANYTRATGQAKSLATSFRTYTIDWQPTHVSWYMDGALLMRQTKSATFNPPDRPLYFLASIWSDAPRGFKFGGRLDPRQSPYTSTLSRILQVTCSGPATNYGPRWARGGAPGDALLQGPPGGAAFPVDEGIEPEVPPPEPDAAADPGFSTSGPAVARRSAAAPAPAPARSPLLRDAPPEVDESLAAPVDDDGSASSDSAAALSAAGKDSGIDVAPVDKATASPEDGGVSDGSSQSEADPNIFGDIQSGFADDPPTPPRRASSPATPSTAGSVAAASVQDGGASEVLDPGTVSVDEATSQPLAPPPVAAPSPSAPRTRAGTPAAATKASAGWARGVFLGCYDGGVLQLDFAAGRRLTPGPAAAHGCMEHCRSLRAPIYSLDRTYRCLCLADAPHPAAALSDSACEMSGTRRGAPMYYVHSIRGETCSVKHTPVKASNFDAVANENHAGYDGPGDSLTLKMAEGQGARVVAKGEKQRWGMLSFKAKATDASGVITTVALRSDTSERAASSYDGMSFQFINGYPAGEPGSLWLDAHKGSTSLGEYYFPPSLYSQLLGRKASAADGFHAYTIDWQPGAVSWYMDGALMMRKVPGDSGFVTPTSPMQLVAAIWTDASGSAFPFGGKLAAGAGPFQSTLSNILRVACQPGAAPRGPSWLPGPEEGRTGGQSAAAGDAGDVPRTAATPMARSTTSPMEGDLLKIAAAAAQVAQAASAGSGAVQAAALAGRTITLSKAYAVQKGRDGTLTAIALPVASTTPAPAPAPAPAPPARPSLFPHFPNLRKAIWEQQQQQQLKRLQKQQQQQQQQQEAGKSQLPRGLFAGLGGNGPAADTKPKGLFAGLGSGVQSAAGGSNQPKGLFVGLGSNGQAAAGSTKPKGLFAGLGSGSAQVGAADSKPRGLFAGLGSGSSGQTAAGSTKPKGLFAGLGGGSGQGAAADSKPKGLFAGLGSGSSSPGAAGSSKPKGLFAGLGGSGSSQAAAADSKPKGLFGLGGGGQAAAGGARKGIFGLGSGGSVSPITVLSSPADGAPAIWDIQVINGTTVAKLQQG